MTGLGIEEIRNEAWETTRQHAEEMRALAAALLDNVEAKQAVQRCRRAIDEIEAEAVLNGLAVGSNEQQRKAALLYALKGNLAYQDALRDLAAAEQRVSHNDASATVAEQMMRRARATLDFLTSCNNRLAGTKE